MDKSSLKETLAGLVHDMFKAAGLPISIQNYEKLEVVAPKLSEAIRQEARSASLVLVKKLQEATINGFEVFSNELDTLKEEVKALKNEVSRLKNINIQNIGDGK